MAAVTREVPITGTSYHKGAQNIVNRLRPGSSLVLRRDPKNKADVNALAILFGDTLLGYLPRPIAADFAPWIDSGGVVKVKRSSESPGWGMLTLTWDDGRTFEDAGIAP